MAKKQNKPQAAAKPTASRKSPAALQRQAKSAAPESFVVRGVVSDAGGSPAAGLTVVAFDKDMRGEDRLGQATTDQKGGFKIVYSTALFRRSPKERGGADVFVRVLNANGELQFQSKIVHSAPADLQLDLQLPGTPFIVRGQVRLADGSPAAGVLVRAYDQDLRKKTLLGKFTTLADGRFEIIYLASQFRRAEKGSADLLVKAFDPNEKLLAAAPVLFNAPAIAEVDLTISAEIWQTPALFERIGTELAPLLEDLKVEELEEDKKHQDLSFLSSETGLEKKDLARYVLAHQLVQPGLQPEFWFALLGGSFFPFADGQSLAEQQTAILDLLSSLNDAAVRKALTRAFDQKEIPETFRKQVAGWMEAFLELVASRSVRKSNEPTFIKSALDHAGIDGVEKQEKFARLFNQYKTLTPELLEALDKDPSFKADEIADLHTSFRLADLTDGGFSVIAMLKDEFDIRQPEKIRPLAKMGEQEWVDLIKTRHAAGDLDPPPVAGKVAGKKNISAAEAYGKTLERRFREAFPTTAFSGGLERALQNGGAHGLGRARDLGRFLEGHEQFELLKTPVDDFLKTSTSPDFKALAQDENFRLEVKAVQRVFKLAPTFEATDALLADNLHSSQKIYRMGESEFVRSYAGRAGFTAETARQVWNRAADTHAAVLTLVADLKSLEHGPRASQNDPTALSDFPDWENLFKTGDQCDCEPCRSVIGPAAYFADLLMFLKDRKQSKPGTTVRYSAKDVLFRRRPDLGYLELNCDNALIPLPYIDVVCEVLEDAIAAGENDVEIPGFVTVPVTLGSATLSRIKVFLALGSISDTDVLLSQVDPADSDRWVVHTDAVTYLLKKKKPSPPPSNFFVEILRNTKASAAELRAYPQYVNPKAYGKLRRAMYPFTLPFDLYAEEVRAIFQKTDVRRWDLMRTFQGPAAPNNSTEGDAAAEYFNISIGDKPTEPSEKSIILTAAPTGAEQQIYWGLTAAGANLTVVTVFLQKTGLAYNDLLTLLDLRFTNPKGDIVIEHLDSSCDTDKKKLLHLDADKLDRIHRFLRLWRKLPGWKMGELDLVIRYLNPVGNESIDEPFLINLFYFSEVQNKLGRNATIEQVCALFGNLNTATCFTHLHEKRGDALYQSLFLNKSLIHPLDPFFAVARVSGPTPTTEKIASHQPAVLAALGLRETDLNLLKRLAKSPSGTPYITDDLTLTNLSFLWRHAWLAKLLKFNAAEWKTILEITPEAVPIFPSLADARNFLETKYQIKAAGFTQAEVDAVLQKIFRRDVFDLTCPKAALEFLEEIEQLRATGFTVDELNWLLRADPSAKAALKETDAARFFAALRKDLQGIRAEFDPAQYEFLTTATSEESLIGLVTTLLQKLGRDETAVAAFLKILRGSVQLETGALLAGFTFPPAITAAPPVGSGIPIQYNAGVLRFTGLMTDSQRAILLNDTAPALVTLRGSGQLEATVAGGLPGFAFPTAITAVANIPIQYAASGADGVLRFAGLMSDLQRTTLLQHASLSVTVRENPAYQDAIEDLLQQSLNVLNTYRSAIEELHQQSLTAASNYLSTEGLSPGGVTLPTDRPSLPLRYNTATQTLSFIGVMTAAEKAALNTPANAPAFPAIAELFQRPRLAVKFFEPEFTASLSQQPSEVDFPSQLPAELALKIAYDSEQRLLRFSGIMSDAEKAALLGLSGKADFIAAVNSLAAQPSGIASTDGRVWLTDDDLDITRPATDTYAKRLANAALKALTYLSATSAENTIVRQISVPLGLTEALTRRLLSAYAVVPILPAPTKRPLMAHLTDNFALDSATFASWFWTNRVAAILKKWKITLTELETLDGLQTGAELLALTSLPLDVTEAGASLEEFLRTHRVLQMRDVLPETEITLLEVLEKLNTGAYAIAAAASNPAVTEQHLFAVDVAGLNDAWQSADVEALLASLDVAFPADYLRVENWERLRRAFDFLENLNASADTVKTFAAAAMTDVHAKALKELLRAKFGAETWLAMSAEIQDVLRERKRDALTAYLLTQSKAKDAPSGKWENANDLYAYYLLDVEMTSCQLTSRLVQASGSVQLFVQRCFMALEPDVVAVADGNQGDGAWRWWKWMRKYQVWVANRKVFLWPENWIEPELKKDRSPFFKDLENEMQQNDINQGTVETAFLNYLEKLDGVAQLEIAGLFHEDNGDNTIVHVFGRTAGAEPHLYYYRRYDYRQWSPWEKVELDIQGDYLVPGVINNRLFLFWPVFTEVPEEIGNSRVKIPPLNQHSFTPDKTVKRLRLQMALSEYRQGKWTPKKVSKDFDESASYNVEIVRKNYAFFFIDDSIPPHGRVRIQYSGYSVASNTKAALQTAAEGALADKQSAEVDKKAAETVLNQAKFAAVYIQVAAVLAKDLLRRADDIFNGNQGPGANAGATAGYAQTARDATSNMVASFVTPAYTALVLPGVADPADDAPVGLKDFENALNALRDAFEAIRQKAAIPSNAATVKPYTENAQKAANTAVDAGTEALRIVTSFRDSATEDARAAGKAFRKAGAVNEQAQSAFTNFKPDDTHRAILSGAFEISGCTGGPEKVAAVGTFTAALYPEPAAVGEGAAFLKWVELPTNNSSTNDFTLETPLSIQYTKDTVILGETPDIFKMAPAWHFSHRDKVCHLAEASFNKVGTFLPFFYNDKKRTFFVRPSLLITNQGYSTYPELEKYLAGFNISDQISIRSSYLLTQKFHFKNFYHPFVCSFASLVNNPLESIPALMSRETQLLEGELRFEQDYQPSYAVVKLPPEYASVADCYPREVVDFTPDGAYSPYNWELFFHAPLLIANSLSKNQRFEEARDWYHFIFNPVGVQSPTAGGSPMSKYWITKPFFQTTDPQYIRQRIDNIMRLLAGDTHVPGYSTQARKDLEGQVFDWRTNPFEPHRIANYRTVAYQKTVVMKYLDNLIAWGDNLFRQDGMESINEATQLYILAAEILGPAPKKIPPQVKPPVASFNELEAELDKFSNALVQVENLIPMLPTKKVDGEDRGPLPMLYFCIPQNDKMLGYWDLVADRLYKIRHCMNIEGVVRQLALFEPPIDPAALVKAVAGGVDISAALADLNAPLPLYRFNVLLQKANEVCNDVKALGGALLAALEKNDAEALGLLRQGQEIRLLEAVKTVREKQIEEAKENLAGVQRNRELAEIKKKYYENKEFMNALETASAALAGGAIGVSGILSVNEVLASIFFLLPSFNIGLSGFGGSPQATAQWGSENIAKSIQSANSALQHAGSVLSQSSSMVAATANYQRRKEEWDFQKNLAYKESEQFDRLIAAAELRIAIAEKELANHVIQIENARATDEFMRSKYTSQELFQWQVGQISGVYFQSYKLAYDLAKRAERCFRFEVGLSDSSHINFGYWDSLKKGLMSGEKLQYDLRRLETAYLEQNRREFELTKHVSLTLLDPLALVKLRETGRCFFRLPEEIFDLDYPGHYFRRLKSVSLTLPCVVGPYTTISCTLRLLRNSVRINTAIRNDRYERNTDAEEKLPADDDRFVENNIPVKSIASSHAQNDSGVFELNFRDERYLPFEGAGAISEWSLELFNDASADFGRALRQFDYGTISDAILHVKYTARENAGPFKNAAIAHLREHLAQDDATPSQRLFNLRQEFPAQWHRFLHPANPADGNVFELEMSPQLFRLLDGKKTLSVTTLTVLARCTNAGSYQVVLVSPLPVPPPASDANKLTLAPLTQYGGLHFSQKDVAALGLKVAPTASPVKWQLKMTRPGGGNLQKDQDGKTEVEELILVLEYAWE